MISQVGSSTIRNAYASGSSGAKEVSKRDSPTVSKQGDMSKIDKIKESLESGKYKIDIQALSEKIAQELL